MIAKGGFLWSETEEGTMFWRNCLENLYNNIQIYKNKLYTT